MLDEFGSLLVGFLLVFVGMCWFSLAFEDFRWCWLSGLVGFAGLQLGIDAFGLVMLVWGRFWSGLHGLNGSAIEVQWKCNGSAVEVKWKCSESAVNVQGECRVVQDVYEKWNRPHPIFVGVGLCSLFLVGWSWCW